MANLLGFAEKKVPGGKLLKAQIEFEATILDARFFGDFFLYPEDALEAIEQTLLGIPANFSAEQLEAKISNVLKKKKAQLIGVSPKDFVEVVQEAMQHAWQK